jgi:hypothetical protein
VSDCLFGQSARTPAEARPIKLAATAQPTARKDQLDGDMSIGHQGRRFGWSCSGILYSEF